MTLVVVYKAIYHYAHIMHYIWISSNWNKLLLKHIYKARSGGAMMVCRIKQYCYSFQPGFSCVFQLYVWLSVLWYGCGYHVVVLNGQPHLVIVYRTVFTSALFWCGVSFCVISTDLYIHYYSFWPTHLGFIKLGCFCYATTHLPAFSSPRPCLWILDWSCNLRASLRHV